MQDSNLIIIASQPRSGSTLLQALLSNNKHVATVSEPWLLLPFLSYLKPEVSNSVYNSSWALSAMNEFKKKSKSFDTNLSNFLLQQYSNTISGNEVYSLDKTPRYYEILDEIQESFPNAKFIILKRNPLSVLSSIINTWTIKEGTRLRLYSRDLLHAPHLLLKFEKKNQNNKNVKSLKYEDLTKNPEKVIKELYDWLDIPFNESVLNYGKNDKFKGRMGDPTGIKSNSSVKAKDDELWKDFLQSKDWKDFYLGYSNFLGSKFLKEYGDYAKIPFKKTNTFQYYLSLVEGKPEEVALKKTLKMYAFSKLNKIKIKNF